MARRLPPESSSVELVSREVGVSAATLERWRADALANGSGDRTGGSQRWTGAARLQALIATAGMDEATRSGWCREQGLYPAELAAWQQDAIAGLGEPRAVSAAEARQDRRRVKDLERELHRKDRALAETPIWPAAPRSPRVCMLQFRMTEAKVPGLLAAYATQYHHKRVT